MSDIVELTKEQLRQLQLIDLEMMIEVDRICRKNGIKYWLNSDKELIYLSTVS